MNPVTAPKPKYTPPFPPGTAYVCLYGPNREGVPQRLACFGWNGTTWVCEADERGSELVRELLTGAMQVYHPATQNPVDQTSPVTFLEAVSALRGTYLWSSRVKTVTTSGPAGR